MSNIYSSEHGGLLGTTGGQQSLNPFGSNSQEGALSPFAGTQGMGKIGDVDSVTGLINRMVQRGFVDNWKYETPYLRFARELPVDYARKIVQLVAPKIVKGEEFDPYNAGKMIERRYPTNETQTHAINFTRQYIVSIASDLLQRGGDEAMITDLAGQQIGNLVNQKNVELTEKINDVICKFIIDNRDRLINIQFNPADPNNPTAQELTELSAKIDRMNMRMTRFVGSDFALSDVGYTTPYDRLVIDTTTNLPSQLKNKVFPYAFNNGYFTFSGSNGASEDGRKSDKMNVLQYLPEGVWGFVRDRDMLTVGQALNAVDGDNSAFAYTRSYNMVHNYWASIFMDVFKRGYLISTAPDTIPNLTTVSVSGINATVANQLGASVSDYSLSSPYDLTLHVTPTGNVTENNKGVELPKGHSVTISIVDADGKAKRTKASSLVDDLDRIKLQADLQVGDVVTFNVKSNYFNPSSEKQSEPLTTTATLNIVK